MKYLILVIIMVITGCKSSGATKEEGKKQDEPIVYLDDIYIVAGQSNAVSCDWGYFEGMTGSKIINMAIPAHSIELLIEKYNEHMAIGVKPKGIIFVHGETDGKDGTNLDEYNSMVEKYRLMISKTTGVELPLYISTVGYWIDEPDINFDLLRESVIKHSTINKMWNISYNDVKNFRDWGLLFDGLHFKREGCDLMMEGIAASI